MEYEVGQQYIDKLGATRTILAIGRKNIFYSYADDKECYETSCAYDVFETRRGVLKSPKIPLIEVSYVCDPSYFREIINLLVKKVNSL